MVRIIVGLFPSASEAEFAAAQLQAAGIASSCINVATQATLQAQHLADVGTPTASFQDVVANFFSGLFSSSQLDDAQAHIAAARPDTSIITVDTATTAEAEVARDILDRNGAIDVYKQRPITPTGPADGGIDLAGDLGRLRDDGELDANGLTTH